MAAPVFYGHALRTPRIKFNATWEPLWTDLGGVRVPFDWSFQGHDALISVDLTRFNWGVYNAIADRPRAAANLAALASSRGLSAFGDIGSLVVTEGLTIAVWVQWPYGALKPAMGGAGAAGGPIPAGFRFLYCRLQDDEIPQMGSAPLVVNNIFHAARYYDPTTGGFACYDFDMTGLSTAPPN